MAPLMLRKQISLTHPNRLCQLNVTISCRMLRRGNHKQLPKALSHHISSSADHIQREFHVALHGSIRGQMANGQGLGPPRRHQ